MNIATRQTFATATVLAVIGQIAMAIGWTYMEVADASRQRRQTTEIVQRYTELRLVSFDYLRNRQERAQTQWHAVSRRIDALIAANHFSGAEPTAIVAGLRERRAAAPLLFAEIAEIPQLAALPGGGAGAGSAVGALASQRFEDQLVSRLLINQQDSLADAFRLGELASERIEAAQRQLVLIIVGGLALIALISGGLSWLIHRHVLSPIIRLQRITQEVAAGNLNLSLGLCGHDEIGALSRNFDAMTQALRASFAHSERSNHELAAANTELEAFSYSVSHDLRAPLRSVDGFSMALIEDYSDKLDADGQDALQRIHAASRRMGALIDDLLRLSKLGRTALEVVRVDLSAMAHAIAEDLDRESAGRSVQWAIAPDLQLDADPALLRIAVHNLLQNAWKFTAGKQPARIRVGVLQREAQTVFFVADNGVGFDMKHADRLFGAFQRLHPAEDFPGTGIGLAIVQRIIRRHGGEVWAEAAPGQGATFYFQMSGRLD